MPKLTEEFFIRDALTVGRELVGKYLVREIDNEKIIVQITETESYLGDIDKACHAYGGKITDRTKTFYMVGSTIYVYLIYGMYYCLNIVTDTINKPSAVLIRGAKPVENIEKLSMLRYNKPYDKLSLYQKKNFLNGPGKLCKGLNIDKTFNETSILDNNIYILDNKNFDKSLIKTGKRINIDYAEEAKDFLWRFYI